jgi:hypothetical protein
VEAMLLEIVFSILFQHDGEPPHFGQQVMAYLNQHYWNQWIGHADPNFGQQDFQI